MASNPHNEKTFKNFVDSVVKNGFKTQGIEKPLTWINPELFKILNKNDVSLKTPVIVFQDDRVGHVVGNRAKLTPKELKQAYSIVNNPDGIYLDYTSKGTDAICYVKNIPNSDECYKVCIKLSKMHSKTKSPVNYFSTMGKTKKVMLLDEKMYKKIE